MDMKRETSDFRNYACLRNGVQQYGRLYGRLCVKVLEKPSASTFTREDGGNKLLQIVGSHGPGVTCRKMNIISFITG